MLYNVRVPDWGSFDLERDEPPETGDMIQLVDVGYRVLGVHPGEWPYDGIIEAERIAGPPNT